MAPRRPLAGWFAPGLLTLVTMLCGCGSTAPAAAAVAASPSSVPTTPTASPSVVSHYIYAAQSNGSVAVYDIDQSHKKVKAIPAFACCADVRGAAAAAPTHRFYIFYNRSNQGHVVSIDLLTDQVLWDKVVHTPGIDRGNIRPDGRFIYLPSWEGDASSPYELVLDAMTGDEVGRISIPARSHDTIVSLDGQHVFMETKSATGTLYVADTTTNQVVESITGYCCSKILAPFSINGTATTVVNDVYGYYGFEVADIRSGHVTAMVPFTGTMGSTGHGIAWRPDETEVWADDGGNPYVHVFDMTTIPPVQTHLVRVTSTSPHWVTFNLDGRFAYVAGPKGSGAPTDIIDTSTYQRIGALTQSEDLLEVDIAGGNVVSVGNQFGVGRVTHRMLPRPE